MTRILVAGPRDWVDESYIHILLDDLFPKHAILISGCAPGVDRISIDWARLHNIPIDPYPADWQRDGKSAGYRRNRQMLTQGRPTHVWCIQPADHDTRGTQDMYHQAKQAGVKTYIFRP